jgi:hypothetical protein
MSEASLDEDISGQGYGVYAISARTAEGLAGGSELAFGKMHGQ